ncbi:uracil-DNA glycosylase family protein [Paludibaculum fermentans]|uniref:uracil-DNA glycosylase family protein n=1 Tax=Paludibaculum fermentans TaxID=1473598 RepID=UPI003EBCF032
MNISDPIQLKLLQGVYPCRECAVKRRAFVSEFSEVRPGYFFKFPPLIGGSDKVKLLFVGYNPRRTSNQAIHNFAMNSFQNFCKLSNNVDHNGQPYIGSPKTSPDHEPHYDLHDGIVQRVFDAPFSTVAAVTEMYLCASVDGQRLQTMNSLCARLYLNRTLAIANPEYIITFGVGLPRFFAKFVRGIRAAVFHLPFPSSRTAPESLMKSAVDWAVTGLLALEGGRHPPPMKWKWPSADPALPQGVMAYQ